ncbi:UDP-glucuronic acid decarboxylase family protein [Halobaculum sp. D14]|uniref:UDP-glucuronic acid decarboxylase family protein n=1 Tax=Halobaculum sp. D14 TaxID=3421642 RepID=UPI003EB87922
MGEDVLVTGGAGFVGSHLVDSLLDDGHAVTVVDNFTTGRNANVASHWGDSDFTAVDADVRSASSLPDVDAIYHLATRASPTDFAEYPVDIALTNSVGTKNLLDHARECDARFLLASTSEVYGDPEVHPQHEEYNGNVDPRGPRACYDEAKRFAETLTVAYGDEYGVETRTARIFNTYGPRMREDDGRVIPTFVSQALAGEDLTVYGDGTQTRSFCYVSDLVAGLRALMETEGLDGDVVNLGNEHEVTINELAERIRSLCDTDSGVTYSDLPEDDPQRRRPDIGRAAKLLDWEPDVRLEDGLARTIDYFRDA